MLLDSDVIMILFRNNCSNVLIVEVLITSPEYLIFSSGVTLLRDWSLITGRGGLQNGKIATPPTIWLKLQATV